MMKSHENSHMYLQIYKSDWDKSNTPVHTLVGLMTCDQAGEKVKIVQGHSSGHYFETFVDEYGFFMITNLRDPNEWPIMIAYSEDENGWIIVD